MHKFTYAAWLKAARRFTPCADSAADLLQDALEVALLAGRAPLQRDDDGPWFRGVLKRRAAFIARGDIRRRARDIALLGDGVAAAPDVSEAPKLPAGLPPAARRVLILALHGLDRAEIRQVLGIGDTALRQRLSSLRVAQARNPEITVPEALQAAWGEWLRESNPPDAGLRRAALNGGPGRLQGFRFGFADPDGNVFSLSSHFLRSRQQEDAVAVNRSGDASQSADKGNKPC